MPPSTLTPAAALLAGCLLLASADTHAGLLTLTAVASGNSLQEADALAREDLKEQCDERKGVLIGNYFISSITTDVPVTITVERRCSF